MSQALIEAATVIPHQRWWRILPPTLIIYIFGYMDRTSLGFAMAGGLNETIGMTASVAGMAGGVFYFGYLLLQVPGGDIAEKGSAKKFLTWCIVAFGVFAFATGLVRTKWELLALRFLLGLAEGGVMPAVLVILSHWFPDKERARANAIFIMNNAIASVITGPIAGWLITAYGWRYVFFVEGTITVFLIFVWWPLIDDSPEKAKWLSRAERDYLVETLKQEREREVQKSGKQPVNYRDLLGSVELWKLVIIYFCIQVAVIAYVLWLPTMIKTLMKTGMTTVGLLAAVPYIATIVGLYLFAVRSDRSGDRRINTAIPILCFAICFFLSVQTKHSIWVSYAFLVGVGFFQQAHNGVFWSIPPMLFPREVAGGARGLINGCGNLGGFFGPTLVGWFITAFHSPDKGIYVLSGFLLVACIVTLTLPARVAGKAATGNSA
jgi:MFS family permease